MVNVHRRLAICKISSLLHIHVCFMPGNKMWNLESLSFTFLTSTWMDIHQNAQYWKVVMGQENFCFARQFSKTICQGTSEGGWCCGQQRKCWMDGIKEWTSLPMPEWLTRASCCKDWKRISAEFLMSPWRPNGSRDWTELNSVRALFVFFPSPACRRICIKMLSFDRFVVGHEKFWFAGTRVHFLARNILWLGQWRC